MNAWLSAFILFTSVASYSMIKVSRICHVQLNSFKVKSIKPLAMSMSEDAELASTFNEVCLDDKENRKLSEPPPLYVDPSTGIRFRQYYQEPDLHEVISLIATDLSEPYSIYTYRYFIYNWPNLCLLAFDHDHICVGTIVCKVEMHSDDVLRGYIAMLAVKESHRRLGIGSRLAQLVIKLMIQDGCDEVVLETEVSNKSALSLYEQLGFCRDERLLRYYLNGADAFRLKLWLKPLTTNVYNQLTDT